MYFLYVHYKHDAYQNAFLELERSVRIIKVFFLKDDILPYGPHWHSRKIVGGNYSGFYWKYVDLTRKKRTKVNWVEHTMLNEKRVPNQVTSDKLTSCDCPWHLGSHFVKRMPMKS